MNSSNSSKPLSSDGLKRKTKSLRPKNTGRKPGGQPGHTGQTLQQSPTPDITQSIALDCCPDCGVDLCDEPAASEEKRQIFDLPAITMKVSEYRAECKWCPRCAKWVTAPFPAEVIAPVQYGHCMQSVMSYLNIAQLLPCERTAEVCQDLFGHRPSVGSVVRAVARCAERVAPAVDRIAEVLREVTQLHADETGVRCAGHTEWIHVASNATYTLHNQSAKRGRTKQSIERNLLVRLHEKRDEVLRFAHDLYIPFDNNQAERDLRMIKVQQKAPGCFRSERGARTFCAIRSYLSITCKHDLNLMNAIKVRIRRPATGFRT